MEANETNVRFKIINSVKELAMLRSLLDTVFETESKENKGFFDSFITNPSICAIGAFLDNKLVGGLVAYELLLLRGEKEFYLYDIAVLPIEQKKGIGTGLITTLIKEAKQRQVSTIFVEAEADDLGALAFYRSLMAEELAVRHFNIDVL